MSHQAVLQLLAIVMLVCIGFVTAIDLAVELGLKLALRMKWNLMWYIARYTAIVCGILLALDTLTD